MNVGGFAALCPRVRPERPFIFCAPDPDIVAVAFGALCLETQRHKRCCLGRCFVSPHVIESTMRQASECHHGAERTGPSIEQRAPWSPRGFGKLGTFRLGEIVT